MNGQKEQNLAACAHINVERFTLGNDGRVFEEQWRCSDCGTKFVSLGSLFGGPQQIRVMEPMKTLRDEFAMAALTGMLARPAGKEIDCDQLYAIADAMMEARK